MLVYSVDSVDVVLDKSKPPSIIVTAKGMARSSGFTNPRLNLKIHVAPPADGFQELTFEADPPTGGGSVTPALEKIESPPTNIGKAASWLKGIRVLAETNKLEKGI